MNEREFELINIIGGELGVNQRDLSRRMKLSLGMTNMLLKRMVTKGYIRIRQLNKKKVEYLLTPKGFSEKMRKSVRYTLKTIHTIGLVRDSLTRLLKGLYASDVRKFYVQGSADLIALIEMVLQTQGFQGCELVHIKHVEDVAADGVFLVCREEIPSLRDPRIKAVNIIEELAKDEALVDQSTPEERGLIHA